MGENQSASSTSRKSKELFQYWEIVWDDAVSNSEEWLDIADIAEPMRVTSRGWKVKETNAAITLAASTYPESEKDTTVGNLMTIPHGMIVSKRELKVSNARRNTRD